MTRILSICLEAAAAGVFLLPLMCLMNRLRFHNWKRTTAYLFFSLYLCTVWALVGLPTAAYMRFGANVNMVPFVGMITDLKNTILNVLLFVPLGFLLPLQWKNFQSAKQTVLSGLLISAAIELLQMLTSRATDINDLITNTLGTGLGWLLVRVVTQHRANSVGEQNSHDLWILSGCVFAVMFFLQPFLANAIWSVIY